jgi:hypothetical protein
MTFAYSYSFLNDFRNCPHKAFRKYVKRDLPKEESEALAEGIRVHYELEQFINSGVKPEVGEFGRFVAEKLRERGAEAEKKLGMSKQRVAAGFWDAGVWLRGKIDSLIVEGDTALITDWKTGKKREDPFELKVQALLVQTSYPVTYIYGSYVWLKDEDVGQVYDLSGVTGAHSEVCAITHKAEKCGEAGEWPKNPNPLCGWCPVKDCEYNRT